MKISILSFLFLSAGLAARNQYLVVSGGYDANSSHPFITFDFK